MVTISSGTPDVAESCRAGPGTLVAVGGTTVDVAVGGVPVTVGGTAVLVAVGGTAVAVGLTGATTLNGADTADVKASLAVIW